MTTSNQLSNRFKEVMLSGKLIAFTNFKDQLEQVTFKESIKKVNNLNSIAALTFHVDYYIKGVLKVLKGGSLDIKDKYSFNMLKLSSDKDWKDLKTRLIENSEAFTEAIGHVEESKWQTHFEDKKHGS
tara:strand:+ start:594 stop:977 length:384 start_codon:yes stop_codon:yes gene_type:complete